MTGSLRNTTLRNTPFSATSTIYRSILVGLVATCAAVGCGGGSGDNGDTGNGGDDGSGGSGTGSSTGSGAGSNGPQCGTAPVVGEDKDDVVKQIDGVTVTTLAGTNQSGEADGMGPAASFSNPVNVLLDPTGELVVADYDSGRLRITTSNGAVSTLVNQASFQHPFGLIWTMDGTLIAQTDYNELGESAGPEAGVIWEIDVDAGTATPRATNAGRPRGMATLPSGKIMVADIERHDIRLFDPASGELTPLAGQPGCSGFADGNGAEAQFDRPYGMVVLPDGDVLVADLNNNRIRKITEAGEVSTYAGDGYPDMIDGDLADARFNQPKDLAIDENGNVFVSDTGNHRIRRITPNGKVETVAGDGTAGYDDGDGGAAMFFGQEGIAVTGNGKVVYVADGSGGEVEPYHRVRKITLP